MDAERRCVSAASSGQWELRRANSAGRVESASWYEEYRCCSACCGCHVGINAPSECEIGRLAAVESKLEAKRSMRLTRPFGGACHRYTSTLAMAIKTSHVGRWLIDWRTRHRATPITGDWLSAEPITVARTCRVGVVAASVVFSRILGCI